MCFNGAKTYQLGWYSQFHVELPSNGSFNWNGNLVGFAEKSSASSSDRMIIRIAAQSMDIFIHFNRRIGMNIGTQEAGDQVMVTTRKTGKRNEESNLVSKMSANALYTITNFNGSHTLLVIRVLSITITTVPGRANISIRFGSSVRTPSPTPLPTTKPVSMPILPPKIAGYQPLTDITAIGKIDLDMALILTAVGVANYVDAAKAYNSGVSVPGVTLASMSTTAKATMVDCGTRCPYSTIKKYLNYYGVADYGHRITQSALDLSETQGLFRFNMNFTGITNIGRAGT
jgi:hypothetical protein